MSVVSINSLNTPALFAGNGISVFAYFSAPSILQLVSVLSVEILLSPRQYRFADTFFGLVLRFGVLPCHLCHRMQMLH